MTFTKVDLRLQHYPHNDPLLIGDNIDNNSLHFSGNDVGQILVDNGSSIDILILPCFVKMGLTKKHLWKLYYWLISFGTKN